MEEMVKLAKKQLRMQRVIIICLVIVIVMLLAAGAVAARYAGQVVGEVESAMGAITESLDELDIDNINTTISGAQELLESVDEFSAAMDDVTVQVQNFGTWISGLFGTGR